MATTEQWRRAAERGVLDDIYLRGTRVALTTDGGEQRGRVVGMRGFPWLITVIFDDDPYAHVHVDRLQRDVRRMTDLT